MIFIAMALMAVQDMLAVPMTVAEANGRALLAGLFDAGNDWVARFGAAICGATLVKGGFAALTVLCTGISVVSFFSTSTATRLSRRIKREPSGR